MAPFPASQLLINLLLASITTATAIPASNSDSNNNNNNEIPPINLDPRYKDTLHPSWTWPSDQGHHTGNPVFPGWYADPDFRILDGQYWIFPSVSAPYEDQTYFDAFSSHDLLSWTLHPRVLDFASVPWSTNRAAWAPTVTERNGAYFMYFSAGDGAGGIGVARSDSGPGGPYVDVLGRPLIGGEGQTVFGAEPIDPDVFVEEADESGYRRPYLYFGGWSHGVVVELNDDMVSVKEETFREITPPGYVEAPWMLKRGGRYYYMYSVGG